MEVMYNWEKKSLREEKTKKNLKNPSFSSTLLDEIYRSIDGIDDEKNSEIKSVKKSSNYYSSSNNVGGEDEEMSDLKRACLIDKWMIEKKINEKISSRKIRPNSFQDNDPMFFSSTSISSDSSSGGLSSSSSDTEFFSSSKSRKSCFVSPWQPKAVRTSISGQKQKNEFDDYQNQETINKDQETLIKSKSRALKIYANLKKIKQPVSPGARLTSFINNLFTNGNTKKSKNPSTNRGSYEDDTNVARKESSSNCSSRSCLSKTQPPSSTRAKLSDDGKKRTVRFDEDYRSYGHKSIYDLSKSKKCGNGRPPLPQNVKVQQKPRNQDQNYAITKIETLRTYGASTPGDVPSSFSSYRNLLKDDYDYDDAASDSSSDLFEIDFGNHKFCEELPVYETTHFDTNLAIASGLIS